MKGKYITTQIHLACLSKPVAKADIHQQLEETIAERTKIMQWLRDQVRTARVIEMIIGDRKIA